MSLRVEIQEFVDEITGKLHPDEPVALHVHHVVRQGFDVIGVCLQADANVDDLSSEAIIAAQAVLSKLKLGVVARRLATSALPWVIPPMVEAMASFAGTAQEFVDLHVIPRLDMWIETLTAIRDDLAGT